MVTLLGSEFSTGADSVSTRYTETWDPPNGVPRGEITAERPTIDEKRKSDCIPDQKEECDYTQACIPSINGYP